MRRSVSCSASAPAELGNARAVGRHRLAGRFAAVTLVLALTSGQAGAPVSGAEVTVAGATIHVDFERGDYSDAESILGWVHRSAQTVAAYYGRFPVSALRLRLVPSSGGGV